MDLGVIVTPAHIWAEAEVDHEHQLVTPPTVRHVTTYPNVGGTHGSKLPSGGHNAHILAQLPVQVKFRQLLL